MRVGVLGSGIVAQTLAAGFVKHGHEVMLGTQHPAKLAEWGSAHPAVKLGNFEDTAKFGKAVVLAVKGAAAFDVLRSAGSENLAGKLVMDACNPIADAPPKNGVLRFFTSLDDSLMEQLQREFPEANFVKAFNSVGAPKMVNPAYKEGRPTMFICGNNAAAKEATTLFLDEFGWEAADMGTAEAARAIEPLCILWCILGFTKNEWTHAFKLLHQ